jgi:mono/diheme cytochrome c family protein
VPDAEKAEAALAGLQAAVDGDPIITTNVSAIETAMTDGAVDPAVGLSTTALVALEEIRAQADTAGIEVPPSVESAADAAALVAALDAAAAAAEPVAEAATLSGEATTAVEEGSDPDGDGLSSGGEATITTEVAAAITATTPTQVTLITLDPTNPASAGGQPDLITATTFVGNLESLATSLTVATSNQEALREQEQGGVEFLEQSLELQAYSIDFAGVAESMGGTVEEAERAVGLFNSNCARCHTSGFSAGMPFTQEAGSGGFGPALWDGRPVVQFGEAAQNPADDLLIQFLTQGSVAQAHYGYNGFGSGRMPAFGPSLSAADIELLARYLRGGNMDGKEGINVLP